MRKKSSLFLLITSLVFSNFHSTAVDYYRLYYHGLFSGQPTSARAAGMGLTTITLGGIENVVYNPASIGLEQNRINIYANYSTGDQITVGSKFGFFGVSYRVNDKLVLGLSRQNWWVKDAAWTVIIGSFEENVDKSSQAMYTLSGAYEVIPNLQLGLSGNFLIDKAVPGMVTNSEFIASVGAIYDRNVDWIKLKSLDNQKVRFAGSFVNLFMNQEIVARYKEYKQSQELPAYLRFGTSYQASLPFNPGFLSNVSLFGNAPKSVDLSLNLQYGNYLKDKYNTSVGIGAEALFMKMIAFRLGYFFEKRPEQFEDNYGDFWKTTNKKGLTFGYGIKVPLSQLTDHKIPFDADVDMVTFKVLNELNTKNYTQPAYFQGHNFLFAFGLKLRWVKD